MTLTKREREIVDVMSDGLSDVEIGVKLSITERTVQTHLQNIFDKLGVRSKILVLKELGYIRKRDST